MKAHLALLVANVIYGLNYVIAKGIMPDHLQPRAIIMLRVAVTLGIFWLLQAFSPGEKVSRRDMFRLALAAIFGVAANQILFFEGLNLTTPINAAIIITSIPVLVMFFAHFIIHDRLTRTRTAGLLLGAAGALMVIFSRGPATFNSLTLLGNILVFINASSWALFLVLIKPLNEAYHPLTVNKWIFFFGLIIVTPFCLPVFFSAGFSSIPGPIWASIGYVVFLSTAVAYYLNNYSLKSVSPSINGIYIYLQPLIAAVVSILLGKDHLTLSKVMASILIILGVILVSMPEKLRLLK